MEDKIKINFVTTNATKFEVAQKYFQKLGDDNFELVQVNLETPEIQHDSVEEIARQSALWASKRIGEPAVATDTGFFIEALNGFPGPFIKYINRWLTPEDLLSLMKDKNNREAYYIDVLAYTTPSGEGEIFSSKTSGKIVEKASSGGKLWATDAIFKPDGQDKTLAEMDEESLMNFWNADGWWSQLTDYLSKEHPSSGA